MYYALPDGLLINSFGYPITSSGVAYKLFANIGVGSKLPSPTMAISDIFKTAMTVSWYQVPFASIYQLDRATSLDFTQNFVTLYSGSLQCFDDFNLISGSLYFYRVAAKGVGFQDSNYQIVSASTFITPVSNGFRYIVPADVGVIPNASVGDYYLDGANAGTGIISTQAAVGPGKKILVNTGLYDYVFIDFTNCTGSSGSQVIVTNSGGQVRSSLDFFNPKFVKVTGRYDSASMTGHKDYKGWDTNPNPLCGRFGFHAKMDYSDSQKLATHIAGDQTHDIELEYVEAGEGSYSGATIKSDGVSIATINIPSTGGNQTWTTVSTNVNLIYDVQQIRVTAFNGNWNLNWIEFITGSSIYHIEAESWIGMSGVSTEATSDTGGGLDVTSIDGGDWLDYNIDIPQGNYVFNMRVASTVSTGVASIRIATRDMNNVVVHDCYFHDTGGEGIYLGSTQAEPQMQFNGMRIYNNIFVRNGLNAIQTGQLKDDCIIYNNVVMMAAFTWTNAFERFQDQTVQQSSRRTGFQFINNIVIGGGESFINYFQIIRSGLPLTASSTVFQNNAFLYCRGSYMAYNQAQNDRTSSILYSGNFSGKHNGTYGIMYPNMFSTDVEVIIEAYNASVTVYAFNNTSDVTNISHGHYVYQSGDANSSHVTESGNIRTGSLPNPTFKNIIDQPLTFDYATVERWTFIMNSDWANQNGAGTNAGQPRVYGLGEMVFWKGKWYQSLIVNNSGHQPSGNTDAFWSLIVFSNGSIKAPDDCRLSSTDFYALRNIGLTRTY